MNQPQTQIADLRLVPSGPERPPGNGFDGSVAPAASLKSRLLSTVPSWGLSLGLHCALFVVLAASLPGLRGGIVGDPDGDLRSVGIWVGHSGDGTDGDGGTGSSQSPKTASGETRLVPTNSEPHVAKAATPTEPVPPTRFPDLSTTREAAVAPPNPIPTPPILGPGERLERPGLFQRNAVPRSLDGPATNGTANGTKGTGRRGSRGSTPFFGIVDVGSQFVYVIDCSGSMYSHDAMGAAKHELAKSLRTLNRFQQFQIVFYNTEQKWLNVPGKVDFRYFSADEKSLRRANEFMAEIQPEGGTVHLSAITLALRLHPDVIFFLTDGGKPGLSPLDLEELARLNQQHTRIHCVQFSAQDDPDAAAATDFLRKLAAQNAGEYVSRDVSRFNAPSAAPESARPNREEH